MNIWRVDKCDFCMNVSQLQAGGCLKQRIEVTFFVCLLAVLLFAMT